MFSTAAALGRTVMQGFAAYGSRCKGKASGLAVCRRMRSRFHEPRASCAGSMRVPRLRHVRPLHEASRAADRKDDGRGAVVAGAPFPGGPSTEDSKHMHPKHTLAAGVAALMLATPAHAGRPLQTEDAGVLDRASCEVEGAALRLTSGGETSRERSLGLGCGIGWRSQVGVSLARTREAGETARSAQVGGKTGLWRGQGENPAAVTLAWALSAVRVSGDDDWHADHKGLNLVASLPAGPAVVHLNLGHAQQVVSQLVSTTWGTAVEHEGFGVGGITLAPMAELFGDDRESPWWNVALRATLVPEKVFLDVSYGRQMRTERPRLVTAGFKFAF